jgi:hypothetical protein
VCRICAHDIIHRRLMRSRRCPTLHFFFNILAVYKLRRLKTLFPPLSSATRSPEARGGTRSRFCVRKKRNENVCVSHLLLFSLFNYPLCS